MTHDGLVTAADLFKCLPEVPDREIDPPEASNRPEPDEDDWREHTDHENEPKSDLLDALVDIARGIRR